MSSDLENANSSWHSIRPWNPPLTLNVREITSVSATFILSSVSTDVDIGTVVFDDEDERGSVEGNAEGAVNSIISDALAKGLLSLTVNDQAWQRVLIRMHEKADEAIIIIYGFMPGRQYDIDFSLGQNEHTSIMRRQVTTDDVETLVPEIDSDSTTSSDHIPQSTPSSSPSRASSDTPPPTIGSASSMGAPPLTVEERLAQLRRQLVESNDERESLTLSLKTTRREAQKADAALKSEIEILKKASEKHIVNDQRARQKVLALQEAVKRALAAAAQMDEERKEIEASLPALRGRRTEREKVSNRIQVEVAGVAKEREQKEDAQKKVMDNLRSELAALGSKTERLTAKKEKLEALIPDLESQLRNVEQELEDVEAIPHVSAPETSVDELVHDDSDNSSLGQWAPHASLLHSSLPSKPASAWIGPTHMPRPHQSRPPPQAMPRVPILLTNPSRSSTKSQATFLPPLVPSSPNQQPSSTATQSPKPASSTLSSRAPPFEPRRPIRLSPPVPTSPTVSNPIPIQRPNPS